MMGQPTDLPDLLQSWLIALEGARRSPHTVDGYRTGVEQFLCWCAAAGLVPDLTGPAQPRAWLASLAAAGRAGSTMRFRLAALRAFAAWLAAEGEIPANGVSRVDWPAIDEKAPQALTPDQAAALLAQCAGKSFAAVRDAAIIALMMDSGVRADELLAMTAADIDIRGRRARVRRGKGGRERLVPFSAAAAARLDRYARARRRHPYAAAPAFWLALGRPALSYAGLYATLRRRGARAGITVHPHMLRAGFAVTWRRDGGSAEGLMTIAGWRDAGMIARYTRAAETELALAEAERLFGREA